MIKLRWRSCILLYFICIVLYCIVYPHESILQLKMRLNEMYSRVQVGKNLSDMFPTRNGLKQGDALSPLLFN